MSAFLRPGAKRALICLALLLGLSILGLAYFVSRNSNSDPVMEEALETRAEPEGEREGPGLEEWLYQQRAYPAKAIPADAGTRMTEQLERAELQMNKARLGQARALEPEQVSVWAALGPQPILSGQTFGSPRANVSGRVSAIALDPRYDGNSNRTVYVGGAQGGVWKSTDNGANWTPIIDDQPSIAIGAIAIDPKNPNTIYVGTGEGSRCALCYYGAGLLKSTNGGASWTVIPGPVAIRDPKIPAFQNAAFTRIAIDPVNTSTLYVATTVGVTSTATVEQTQTTVGQVGLWKSTDGGATWRNLDPGGTAGAFTVHDVIIDPRNNNRIYAGARTIGIFVSDQGGEPGTWQMLTNGLPNLGPDPAGPSGMSPYRRVAMVAGATSSNTTLYAAFAATNSTLLGIYRSTDSGNNWTQVTSPQQAGQTNYNLDIAMDPGDPNTVYYATQANDTNSGGTLFRSRDGGQNWTDLSRGDGSTGGLHADTHQIVLAPNNGNILFTGNDGGIWRTNGAKAETVSWTQLNDTLSFTQFTGIALHPTDPNFIVGGTQDNGTNRYRGNLGWDHVRDGDGGYVIIDQSNPQIVYHTFFNQNNTGGSALIGPEISFNAGNSWSRRGCFGCTSAQPGNFNPSDRVAFYAPMAQNTGFTGSSGNVVYFGTHRLYRTADQGLTWTGLGASTDGFGADLTKNQSARSVITAIAAHPQVSGNTEIVWVGTNDGLVQVTGNAGALASATFSNVTKAPLPNRVITDFALPANNTQTAFVTYSGFNSNTPSTPGHVFKTTNLGATWQDISGNLPDVPVTSITINPGNGNNLFIGTDLGVFRTNDGGTTWERLGDGMPRVATFMVRYHAASNSVVAATHGRGVYRLATSRGATTVSAANFSANSIAGEAIVSVFGTGLANQTIGANLLPLPTTLAGSRIAVRDSIGTERLSPLFFVSPTQINFQIPPGTEAGGATIRITSGDGTISTGAIQISSVAPSIFAQNANGQGVPAGFALRVASNGAQTNLPISVFNSSQNRFVPTPIDLGAATDQTFLVLFGTGIRFRSSLSNVVGSIGGSNAEVLFAGSQGALVGLDQINLRLSRNLIGRGEIDVALTADGKAANTLRINIK